jgi:hypothetical protein
MATFVVDGGLDIVTNRVNGAGTTPSHIGWGTGAGTTVRTDSTLFTAALLDLTSGNTDHTAGTPTRVTTTTTNDSFQVTGLRTASGAGTVTNAGLWDAASGGNLFLKGDFTGIGLAINDAISFTIKAIFDN